MQNLLLSMSAIAAMTFLAIGPTYSKDYPFCRSSEGGSGDCRFDTLAQCQAAVSGTNGYCQQNYFLTPNAVTPRPARRASRANQF